MIFWNKRPDMERNKLTRQIRKILLMVRRRTSKRDRVMLLNLVAHKRRLISEEFGYDEYMLMR